jgi:hypothetical protein
MRIRSALLAATGSALLLWPACASAQIYVLMNDSGKTIIVPPGEKDPEAFILAKMNGVGGKDWKMERVETTKGCLARRSVRSFNKPVRWVTAFAQTLEEAERAVDNQALAMTNNGSTGVWEKGYCNRATVPERTIDVPALERKFLSRR